MNRGPTALIVICVCVALAFVAGCGSDDSSTNSTSEASVNSTSETASSTSEASGEQTQSAGTFGKKPTVTVSDAPPPKKLEKNELIEGSGAEAKAGDKVTVQYVGVDYKTGKEFDASWDGEPFTFVLGKGKVISGWDQGVKGMKEGGRRELIIPPELAYGELGATGIAPNSTLVFVIDLLKVE